MITISWHLLIFIVVIAVLWIFTFTRDNYGSHFTERDLWVVISLILTIILILIYGGIFSNWEENYEKSVITTVRNAIAKFNTKEQYTFAFPTEEMRNAFYENFKSEIENCKEFL